jgi:hypothetical protein
MIKIETFERLPENYDSRLTPILREPIRDDVIVSFYYIAASKNPSPNYRWDLRRDGSLFLTRHSGRNPTFEVTFDRPLPKRPTKVLSQDEIEALRAQFERADFFNQPGFQRIFVEGGNYVIVRARRDGMAHEVVYENVESPLVVYLYSIAQ